MKLFSLIKAVLSQDMNLFQYKSKKSNSKVGKILLPIFLFLIICSSLSLYVFMVAEKLAPFHLTYLVLILVLFLTTILTFVEVIYKSQSILFDAKDNDLLFSLPIRKGTIIFLRLFKLILYEYLFNLMFLVPAYGVYIFYERPGLYFYLISILMIILLPIVPTIISCFLGYLVKLISSKFKSKKIMQTLLSTFLFMGLMMISLKSNELLPKLAENAKSISDLIMKVYFPIGAYVSLIEKFDLVILIKLILFNIIPFILFILIAQKFYFQIVSRSHNKNRSNKKLKENQIKLRKPISALTSKEIKRYFSSPTYMFNTSFGLILTPIITAILVFKGKDAIVSLLSVYNISSTITIDSLFYGVILFSIFFTSITSSSISLERSTINITKSLPIDYGLVFKSKIRMCLLIELPFIFLSLIIFMLGGNLDLIFILECIALSIIGVLLTAVLGLIVNLKYPKLNATNDTEIIKQSMSSTVAVFAGLGIFFSSIILTTILSKMFNPELARLIHISILLLLLLIMYPRLMKKGKDEYQKLNV